MPFLIWSAPHVSFIAQTTLIDIKTLYFQTEFKNQTHNTKLDVNKCLWVGGEARELFIKSLFDQWNDRNDQSLHWSCDALDSLPSYRLVREGKSEVQQQTGAEFHTLVTL